MELLENLLRIKPGIRVVHINRTDDDFRRHTVTVFLMGEEEHGPMLFFAGEAEDSAYVTLEDVQGPEI